jgi:folylpolyglutamate synthase/dihydropteroate synthase
MEQPVGDEFGHFVPRFDGTLARLATRGVEADHHVAEVRAIDDVADAVRRAVQLVSGDEVLVITGSTYVAGAARTALRSLGFHHPG